MKVTRKEAWTHLAAQRKQRFVATFARRAKKAWATDARLRRP